MINNNENIGMIMYSSEKTVDTTTQNQNNIKSEIFMFDLNSKLIQCNKDSESFLSMDLYSYDDDHNIKNIKTLHYPGYMTDTNIRFEVESENTIIRHYDIGRTIFQYNDDNKLIKIINCSDFNFDIDPITLEYKDDKIIRISQKYYSLDIEYDEKGNMITSTIIDTLTKIKIVSIYLYKHSKGFISDSSVITYEVDSKSNEYVKKKESKIEYFYILIKDDCQKPSIFNYFAYYYNLLDNCPSKEFIEKYLKKKG